MSKLLILLALLAACGQGRLSPQGGTVTSVQGGDGLTGGGIGGAVTLNVVCGLGLTCSADEVSIDGTVNTFSTANVIPKGDGTGLVASSWTDDGTTATTTDAVAVKGTASLGNDQVLIGFAAPIGFIAARNSVGSPAANLWLQTTDAGGATITPLKLGFDKSAEFSGVVNVTDNTVDTPASLWITNNEINSGGAMGRLVFGPSTSTAMAEIRGLSQDAYPPSSDSSLVFRTMAGGVLADRVTIASTGTLTVASTQHGVISTSTAGGSTSGKVALQGTSTGTYDTTGAAIEAIGLSTSATATRTAGANNLRNIAAHLDAAGGQVNIALRTARGDAYLHTTSGSTGIGYASGAALPAKLSVSGTFNTTGDSTLGDGDSDAATVRGALVINKTAADSVPIAYWQNDAEQFYWRIDGAASDRFELGEVGGPTSIIVAANTGVVTLLNDVTIGDAAGDVLDVNGDLTKFGTSAGDGSVYIKNNTIGFKYAEDVDSSDGFINYYGYNGGSTQFRNLVIADGKGAAIATYTGNDKGADFAGYVATDTVYSHSGGTTPVTVVAGGGFVVNETTTLESKFKTSGVIAATPGAGTFNDYAPTGHADAVVVEIDVLLAGEAQITTITGFDAGTSPAGRHLYLVLTPSLGRIQLNHQDSGSSAANRFHLKDGANVLARSIDGATTRSYHFIHNGTHWTHVGTN